MFSEVKQILKFNDNVKSHALRPEMLRAQIKFALKYDLFVENYQEFQKCPEMSQQDMKALHKNSIQYIKDANHYKPLIEYLG